MSTTRVEPISSGLCLSFNFHDREWTSNSVYFRHPLFGLPLLAEGHLCTLRTVRWASSRARPREIRTANENRFGESAEEEGRDTGNLWHAISHRMKTWCHHVDLAGAMQTFRLFHRVLYGFHTYAHLSFSFFSCLFRTPWIKVLYVLHDFTSKINVLTIILCMIFFKFMFLTSLHQKWLR